MELTIPQTAAIDLLEDKTTREVLFGGAAGPGKTTLGCYWQLKNRLKKPGTVGLLGRSTLKTLFDTTVVTFNRVAKAQGVILGQDYWLYDKKQFQFSNGSVIYLKQLFYKPSDEDVDDLGSLELTDAFVDEASQINVKVKNVLKSRIRYMVDDIGPKILYATNPGKNWTKHEFYDAFIKGKLGTKQAFVPALLDSNPFITHFYRENLESLPKALMQRLLKANWNYNDDPSQLMKSVDIANIFTNAFVLPIGKKYITADIARTGGDKTIIRVWHGWRVIQRAEYKKIKLTETAQHIRDLATKHQIPMSQVIADEDGVGGGVVDILNCLGFVANARPNDSYKNRNNKNFATAKDQCGWYLADMINKSLVYEDADPETRQALTEELEQIKDAGLNKDDKNKLVSKEKISEEIGRSPDDSDTYLQRAWLDLRPVQGGKLFMSKPN